MFSFVDARFRGCLVGLLLICCGLRATANEFPYTAYVYSPDSFAMSGPPAVGEYRTERLERGQRLTIYRAERGWCAIRPPRGAFSWVEGRNLELSDERTARVKIDQAPCYVGSQIVDRRDRSQLNLKFGEMLEILGVTETAAGAWYQVAPPAGEFRWVASAGLRRDAPAEWPEARGIAVAPTTADSVGPALSLMAAPATPLNAVPGAISAWQPADPARWRNQEPGAIIPTSSPSPGTLPAPVATVARNSLPAVVAPTAPRAIGGSFQTEFNGLETDLAAVLLQEPTAWNFAELNQRSNGVYERATNPQDRGKVREWQGKLARLDELRRRSLDQKALFAARPTPMTGPSPYPMPPRSTQWTPGITPATPLAARSPSSAAEPELGRYDGIGYLMEVKSSRPDAPKYALVDRMDSSGKVVAYLLPGTNIDFAPYFKQLIGVAGTRSYIPDLKTAVISVNTVGPTDPTSLARRTGEKTLR